MAIRTAPRSPTSWTAVGATTRRAKPRAARRCSSTSPPEPPRTSMAGPTGLRSIEGAAGDRLTGTERPNRLDGQAGTDAVHGRGGDDVLSDGDGDYRPVG